MQVVREGLKWSKPLHPHDNRRIEIVMTQLGALKPAFYRVLSTHSAASKASEDHERRRTPSDMQASRKAHPPRKAADRRAAPQAIKHLDQHIGGQDKREKGHRDREGCREGNGERGTHSPKTPCNWMVNYLPAGIIQSSPMRARHQRDIVELYR